MRRVFRIDDYSRISLANNLTEYIEKYDWHQYHKEGAKIILDLFLPCIEKGMVNEKKTMQTMKELKKYINNIPKDQQISYPTMDYKESTWQYLRRKYNEFGKVIKDQDGRPITAPKLTLKIALQELTDNWTRCAMASAENAEIADDWRNRDYYEGVVETLNNIIGQVQQCKDTETLNKIIANTKTSDNGYKEDFAEGAKMTKTMCQKQMERIAEKFVA